MRVRERREIRSKTFFDILLHISSTIHMQEEEKNKKNKKQTNKKTNKQTNKQRLLKWRKRKCRFSERDKQRRRKRV